MSSVLLYNVDIRDDNAVQQTNHGEPEHHGLAICRNIDLLKREEPFWSDWVIPPKVGMGDSPLRSEGYTWCLIVLFFSAGGSLVGKPPRGGGTTRKAVRWAMRATLEFIFIIRDFKIKEKKFIGVSHFLRQCLECWKNVVMLQFGWDRALSTKSSRRILLFGTSNLPLLFALTLTWSLLLSLHQPQENEEARLLSRPRRDSTANSSSMSATRRRPTINKCTSSQSSISPNPLRKEWLVLPSI